MHGIVMPPPDTEAWKKIEEGFRYRWNYPNCIGAMDGKHVVIQAPPDSGSMYYNYKGTFSMVLLAVADYQYRFTYIDFGEYGSNSDNNVFKTSTFGRAYTRGLLNVPGPKALPGVGPVVPHCIVADEGFPLRIDLMRPYPRPRNCNCSMPRDELMFNQRLSRPRNICENCFGILVNRWRIFQRKVCLSPENIEKVVLATCCLHNWLQEDRDYQHIINELRETNVQLANNEPCMRDMPRLHGYHSAQMCLATRNKHKDYFNGIGALPWQDEHLRNRHGV